MKQSSLSGSAGLFGSAGFFGSARMGWKLALVVGLAPSAAWGQDCQEDADCGHGFQCIHESGGTSSVTGVGGSMQAECGDGICEFGAEDIESCPQDCDTLQYCAPAECDSSSDCAEGYECGEEIGSNSSFTSAGGSSSSVCGDGNCDFDESNASCPDDCAVYRLCQPIQMTCSTDDDCAEGFYCYVGVSDNVATVGFSSVDSGTSGSDTAAADSGSGNTDAGTGGTGFAPPADTTDGTSGGDETGVCVAEASDSGGSAVNSGSNGGTMGGSSGPSGTTSADTDGQAANSATSGAGGASAVGGDGSPATNGNGSDGETNGSDGEASSGSGTGSGSDAGGAGSDPDAAGESDDDGGCSCSVLGAQGSSGLLGAALFGLVAGIRRRRNARS